MAWTLTQLATLERAIATGATSVQYQDRKVVFGSRKEMLALRNEMRRELGLLEGRNRRWRVTTHKDLD